MTKLLFICLGNICRSPMAETVFRHLVEERGLEDRFEVDSAGLIDYHEGEMADNRMRRHASMHGYYITHRSRPVETDDFRHFDYIIGMDRQNIRALETMQPADSRAQILDMASFLRVHKADSVPDPYYGGEQGFERVIALLEDACASLLDRLTSEEAARA